MTQNRWEELEEIKLELAALSVQLDALAARTNSHFLVPSDRPAENVDQSFALRAVLAMRHSDKRQDEY
ncbi:MAG: hypothetical protein J0H42_18720 [Rhizobiales bacterium]|nr:hypothetical protein [Hyphomicrobiales bacterium]MBN8990283.1 hypothetical protein [Hyphomicrobiales bacterium]